ncbi:MAG TPA: OB-fold domain-containing protein [Actinomycetota bacterium]
MTGTTPLPLPDEDTAFFWEACARGELHILRCRDCRTWIHYPRAICRACGGSDLAPEPVSGRGVVHTFTVTHREAPGKVAPFVVALIELEEQAGLRMVSNVIGIEPGDVAIGMPVEVMFEPAGEHVTLPLFGPRSGA